MKEFIKDKLTVKVFDNRNLMGEAVASAVAERINILLSTQAFVNIIFGAAPSQNEFFEELLTKDIDWARLNAFHMDEYVGLSADCCRSFRNYLHTHFLDHVEIREFHGILGESTDSDGEARRYESLLDAGPIDVISMGIGENGHIAFNDPPAADFDDRYRVKKVELDPICRQQQVNDGCFASLDEVPTHALTLTLPVFASAGLLACIVPSSRKAEAVRKTLAGAIGTDCPATLLRQHANSHLFIDRDAASLIVS